MKFLEKLWLWLRFALPITLITIGIILNGYAAIKFINHKFSSPSPITSQTPTPSLTPSTTIPPITSIQTTPFTQPKPKNLPPSPITSQTPTPSPTTSTTKPPVTSIETKPSEKPKFGHFPYQESDREQMMTFASYAQDEYQRFEKLAPEAALALMKMIYSARDEGVWVVPVSGFRTVEQQKELFKAQIQRRGSPEIAAKVSAPPGYSEHHTGFAIDLTDGNFPKKDITIDFENTKAFQWLTRHAQKFGFELSFPPNNSQGVSYEPWHWRYIGSPEAAAAFAQARKF
ncbi:MAG: D-alanyl-D-alanine carboxypeptidase family protein [Okeania sp. SIO2C9]|uniref:M15 family metallopeptidase n=1 Tax=Okeania sp. SIO2C9 TaxID=2607791 RepID=UPI0013BF032D|nr:M15 family metallopeptidase [Okeania sp. SIO2C9]NEQ75438.1 D-alanyl-D-alanine carboxypeptidase family protein [Okeania sp. SIO2C9]